jgi:hypothetical protein
MGRKIAFESVVWKSVGFRVQILGFREEDKWFILCIKIIIDNDNVDDDGEVSRHGGY